ncbi:pyridoxamine 5'-phosphate oxidase family protein [Candidatus Bipolaricaulota bacterium]|nr:pyridoxamine 5'-phosphate oxidase family protein [Candidatus Bipolaricaulota bacterium]
MKQQLYRILDAAPYPLLVTHDDEGFAIARPMYLAAREQNVFWFPASARSRKMDRIRRDPRVTLLFILQAEFDYASVYGMVTVVTSPERKRILWHAEWEEQWPGGAIDEDYVLLRVEGYRGEYYRGVADESEQLILP